MIGTGELYAIGPAERIERERERERERKWDWEKKKEQIGRKFTIESTHNSLIEACNPI